MGPPFVKCLLFHYRHSNSFWQDDSRDARRRVRFSGATTRDCYSPAGRATPPICNSPIGYRSPQRWNAAAPAGTTPEDWSGSVNATCQGLRLWGVSGRCGGKGVQPRRGVTCSPFNSGRACPLLNLDTAQRRLKLARQNCVDPGVLGVYSRSLHRLTLLACEFARFAPSLMHSFAHEVGVSNSHAFSGF